MTALPPGATVGILGGGQLGRMLAVSAAQLGLKVHIYTDVPGPACDVAPAHTIAPYDDLARISEFARGVDVVTYEFENVPLAAAIEAQKSARLRPGPKALEVAQDRVVEKTYIAGLGLPVAPFMAVDSAQQLVEAQRKLNTPSILKTARLGYDGKGQVRIDTIDSDAHASSCLKEVANAPCVLEARIAFAFEISIVLVRAQNGEIAFYDTPENVHRNGILHQSSVPARLDPLATKNARAIARKIADALEFVGVLAVEMFYVGDGASEPLIVNEIAPRVHNSGHWTMDACPVSQFENHIRAVAGWPLGPTTRHSDAVMTNLIGHDVDAWKTLAAEPANCVHLYGKPETRPGRKMGHVTRLTPMSRA